MRLISLALVLGLVGCSASQGGASIDDANEDVSVSSITLENASKDKLSRSNLDLYDLLRGYKEKSPILTKYSDITRPIVPGAEIDNLPFDYGFCEGEGWGVLPEGRRSRLYEPSTYYELMVSDPVFARYTSTEQGCLTGSFEDIIDRLAAQAGIEYSIQVGIDVGILIIPDSIKDALCAITTICNYYGLQWILNADETKIIISKK